MIFSDADKATIKKYVQEKALAIDCTEEQVIPVCYGLVKLCYRWDGPWGDELDHQKEVEPLIQPIVAIINSSSFGVLPQELKPQLSETTRNARPVALSENRQLAEICKQGLLQGILDLIVANVPGAREEILQKINPQDKHLQIKKIICTSMSIAPQKGTEGFFNNLIHEEDTEILIAIYKHLQKRSAAERDMYMTPQCR